MQQSDNAPVLFDTHTTSSGHTIGEMTLNSPQSLNALSVDMCQLMSDQLTTWQDDDNVVAVILRGSGDKAFCAGGDIRKLYESMVDNPPMPNPYATEFFGSEYALYRQMHFYPKPLILWGNGIIMGGGMGLMAACSHRVVTDTTKFAMPEITIGLFPDATGSWFLQRMPAKTGLFLGLTGALCNARDALFVSLAEYALPSSEYNSMVAALTSVDWSVPEVHSQEKTSNKRPSLSSHAHHVATRELSSLTHLHPATLKDSKLAQYWQPIQSLMVSGDLNDIDRILQDDTELETLDSEFANDKWTQRAVATYRNGCPVSAALTYELYHRVKDLSIEQILYLETNVAVHCANNPDFKEGVRALLIDKDKNPKWSQSLEWLYAEGRDYLSSHFNNPYSDDQHIFTDWLGDNAYGSRAVR